MQTQQIVKKRNYAVKEASHQPIGTGFKSNKKSRIGNGKKAVLQIPKPEFIEKATSGKLKVYENFSPVLDLNQGDSVLIPIRNSRMVFEQNKKERRLTGKEASVQTQAPIFDLNQISVTH